ncbi:amidohydrolase family protein [Nocardioides zeae]|uniref:Amidohydrolase family protein n=1 Tax=Nocardioides imazamoxiresistens TaxID=3231893 RepID=A0ABU3PQX2_9ACTN|nr:amidohydrolase family protein [Nocardioides zeae]MDT9591631.1 amidohydrolase family protein [Nocardioides zeae]
MIIDCHLHVWPDHIAHAMQAQRPAGMKLRFDGTLDGLLRTMDESGIDKGLALGVGIKASVVAKTNEFIGSVPRDRLVPFGTVHPDLSVEENLRHLRDNGIVGVKLHPLFQTVSLADPKVHEILSALGDEGMPVVTHVGAGADEEANERGAPALLRKLADSIPHLQLIACHYGGYHRLEEAEQHVVGSRVTLETSWPPTMAELEPEKVRDLIRAHGADRVVYGSDWPMADPAAEIAAIRNLGLTPEEEAGILGGNLARILGL